MSAHFLLKFRAQFIRVLTSGVGFEIVPRDQATVFISRADAWLAALHFKLEPEDCEVVA